MAILSSRSLLYIDICFSVLILLNATYTEIDWVAYMQEVQGFLGGELTYTNLKGDTGPLVYPAGFVYVYSALYYVTAQGINVLLAQWLFLALYLVTLCIVLRLYQLCRVPLLFSVTLILSKRIHSLYLLRLFNDCVAMALCYMSVLSFSRTKWVVGSVLYSLGVSIKMNVLLFSPGLLTVFLCFLPLPNVLMNLAVCFAVQVVLAAPFIAQDAGAYMSKAFEFGRVFTFQWSVNYQFLPEEIFTSKIFGGALLLANIMCWLLLAGIRWVPRLRRAARRAGTPRHDITAAAIILTLFESNVVGVIFARSLHYQFYVWFFHQLPFLIYFHSPLLHHEDSVAAPEISSKNNPNIDVIVKHHRKLLAMVLSVAFVAVVEVTFNVYPPTALSSAVLMLSLMALLVMIFCKEQVGQ